jgi:SAM-dependent methyltransferase
MVNLYLEMLNRSAASKKSRAEEILRILDVREGGAVADIGAGGGYFTLEFAGRVGPGGTVYAVDVKLKVLDYIRKRAARSGLRNVVPVLVRGDDFLLPEGKLDLIFLRNVVHHIRRPVAFFKKLESSLRKGGKVAIVDYKKGGNWISLFGHYVDGEQLTMNMKMAGYVTLASHDFLPSQVFFVFGIG